MELANLDSLVTETARRELGENQDSRAKGLRDMREWIQKHPNIQHCRTDDNFLLRFLRVKKYNVTKAQEMLFNFLKLKENFPSALLNNHDITNPSVQEFMCDGFYFASPFRDSKGRKVIILALHRLDVSKKYSFTDPARTIVLSNITMLEEEASQVLGYVYILDGADLSLRYLSMWPSPIDLIRFIKSGESAIPMRNKEVHILNLPSYWIWCVNLLKSAISKKLRKRIVLHRSLDTLHEMVDRKVLPREYGGEIGMEDMIELWREELVRKNEKIKEFDSIKLKKADRFDRSFRNLELD